MTANTIRLDCVQKSFGKTEVIPELTAEIAAGEFTVILGPSGCGKSTLLNMIAGLERVGGGRIFIGDQEVQDVEPKDRGCAMVFQNYALYPHMSVAANIGYSLKVARVPRPDRELRVRAAAEFVGLSGFLERKPSELSGGQRQRVAIARAIVREPKVLLFDEPLSNLDAQLRHDMRMELSELHMRIGATTVFVTHDQLEAMTLADRVLILNNGRVEQFASPHEIYHRPATTFVAGFIGTPAMNLIEVIGDGQCLRLADGTEIASHERTGPAVLGIRPERIGIGDGVIATEVIYREDLGSHTSFVVRLNGGQEVNVATPIGTELACLDQLNLTFPEKDLHLFDSVNGLRL